MKFIFIIAESLLLIFLSVVISAWAQEKSQLPQDFGLSAKYPGDVGIEDDNSVLFSEDFETNIIVEISQQWDDVSNKNGQVLSLFTDAPEESSGNRCLQMTATRGENNGGHLYTQLSHEVNRAFARFYVKFAPDIGYIHHFVHFGGYYPPTPYPQGGAGIRPKGDDRMTVGIEPFGERGQFSPPGTWNFYAYWHEMKISTDGKYWGNGLRPAEPAIVPRNRWQCVEIMFKCNSSPDKSDGELALWLDGELKAHFVQGVRHGKWTGMGFKLLEENGEPFEGFCWRTSDKLKVNFFWLLHYITDKAFQQSENYAQRHPEIKINTGTATVYFDDIVVAKSYIGPIKGESIDD